MVSPCRERGRRSTSISIVTPSRSPFSRRPLGHALVVVVTPRLYAPPPCAGPFLSQGDWLQRLHRNTRLAVNGPAWLRE